MPELERPDADLFVPLLNRDGEALERTYERYGSLAYAIALRILGDPGRAEEVVQDAFTALWSKPSGFDPERGSFRGWFLMVVRNRAIDVLRGRSRGRAGEVELPSELSDRQGGGDPWHSVSLSLEQDEIRSAVKSLSDVQREAIELAFFGGYTHSQIATMLRLPLGTVKGRLRLGLEKLHSYLSGRGYLQG
jgi:RNA polymerase sigma-70 factor (ECF subfamily)